MKHEAYTMRRVMPQRTAESRRFFFSSRRRHTRLQGDHTRLQGDWSSDVCSSDLTPQGEAPGGLFLLDHDGFDVLGRWEVERGPRSEERRVGKECRCRWSL